MKNLWIRGLLTVGTVLIPVLTASADDGAASSGRAGEFLIQSVGLLVILAVLLMSAKVYFALRGGKVGKSWLWLLSGFTVWTIGQATYFCGELGVIPRLGYWIDAIQVLALVLLFVGIMRFRKLFA